MNNQMFLSLCLLVLLPHGVISQSGNATDTSDVINTTTATSTTRKLTTCVDGLTKCWNTLEASSRSKVDVFAYIECLNSIECDDNQQDRDLKAAKLKSAHSNDLHFTTDDHKVKNACSRTLINTILLVVAFFSIAKLL